MKHHAAFILFALVASWHTTGSAAGPTSEKDMPIYPGARQDEQNRAKDPNSATRFSYQARYTASAPIGEVVKHYRKYLALPEAGTLFVALPQKGKLFGEPAQARPGETVLRDYSDDFLSLPPISRDAEVYIESEVKKRDKMRALMQKHRKPDRGEYEWLREIKVKWHRTETNGDQTEIRLKLIDESLQEDKATGEWRYSPITRIEIQRETKVPKSERKERGRRINREKAAAKERRLDAVAPTEKAIGKPIYPGATYDGRRSRDESEFQGDVRHVFVSSDPLDKVKAFYEKSLREKAQLIGIGYEFGSGVTVTSVRAGRTEIQFEGDKPAK